MDFDWSNLFGDGGIYGTSPGISYSDVPQFQASDYPSLSIGDYPLAEAEYRNRAALNFAMPTSLGSAAGVGEDFTGSGMRFTNRPEEALYAAPANIQSPTIAQLAKGQSGIPGLLGSDTPSLKKTSTGLNNDLMMMGGRMMQRGAQQHQAPQAPTHFGEWGSPYQPRSFQQPGAFQNASAYAQGAPLQQTRMIREQLKKKAAFERGLLD